MSVITSPIAAFCTRAGAHHRKRKQSNRDGAVIRHGPADAEGNAVTAMAVIDGAGSAKGVFRAVHRVRHTVGDLLTTLLAEKRLPWRLTAKQLEKSSRSLSRITQTVFMAANAELRFTLTALKKKSKNAAQFVGMSMTIVIFGNDWLSWRAVGDIGCVVGRDLRWSLVNAGALFKSGEDTNPTARNLTYLLPTLDNRGETIAKDPDDSVLLFSDGAISLLKDTTPKAQVGVYQPNAPLLKFHDDAARQQARYARRRGKSALLGLKQTLHVYIAHLTDRQGSDDATIAHAIPLPSLL